MNEARWASDCLPSWLSPMSRPCLPGVCRIRLILTSCPTASSNKTRSEMFSETLQALSLSFFWINALKRSRRSAVDFTYKAQRCDIFTAKTCTNLASWTNNLCQHYKTRTSNPFIIWWAKFQNPVTTNLYFVEKAVLEFSSSFIKLTGVSHKTSKKTLTLLKPSQH